MILDEPGNNVSLAVFLVRRLMSLRALDPIGQIGPPIEQLLPNTFQQSYFAGSPICPRFVYCGNNSRKLFFIDGATTSAQVTEFVNGYDNAASVGAFNPINFRIRQAATFVLARINGAGLQVPEHVDFVGYSIGGAIAIECYRQLALAQSPIKRKCITFGAPRTCSRSDLAPIVNSPITRWMTDADPIPLVPPRITDAPTLIATNSVLTNLRWGAYVHARGGIVVYPNGATAGLVLPPIAAMNPTMSLLNWYFSVEGDPANPHALTTYLAYLALAEQLAATASAQRRLDGPIEQPQQDDRRQLTQRERQVMSQIAVAGRDQNSQPLVVPTDRLFKAVRMGRIWVVEFAGEIIAVAPRKKRAQALARRGNAFVRSLPRQALVQPDSLASQLDAFLAAAVDPASGFQPKIRIGL